MVSVRDPPQNKRSTQAESEGWKKISQGNGHEKKEGVTYLYQTKQT